MNVLLVLITQSGEVKLGSYMQAHMSVLKLEGIAIKAP